MQGTITRIEESAFGGDILTIQTADSEIQSYGFINGRDGIVLVEGDQVEFETHFFELSNTWKAIDVRLPKEVRQEIVLNKLNRKLAENPVKLPPKMEGVIIKQLQIFKTLTYDQLYRLVKSYMGAISSSKFEQMIQYMVTVGVLVGVNTDTSYEYKLAE